MNVTDRGYGVGGAGTQPAGEFAPALVNVKVALLLAVFEPPLVFEAPTTYWHEPLFWFPVPPLLFFFRLCPVPVTRMPTRAFDLLVFSQISQIGRAHV